MLLAPTDFIATLVVSVALLGGLFNVVVVTEAFYLPGVPPSDFDEMREVPLKVNAMTSLRTQVPKDYYRLPFCMPAEGPQMSAMNLGEYLTGNMVQTSPFSLNMLHDVYCKIVCQVQLTASEAEHLKMAIRLEYRNNWIVDNLPSAFLRRTEGGVRRTTYTGGFPLGFIDKHSVSDSEVEFDAHVYNHVNIIIDYEKVLHGDNKYRVVSFIVEPMSIKHKHIGGYVWDGAEMEGFGKPLEAACPDGIVHTDFYHAAEKQKIREDENIIYTYDVIWEESEVPWTMRWEVYLNEDNLVPTVIHWNGVFRAIFLILLLLVLYVRVVITKLCRTITAPVPEEGGEEANGSKDNINEATLWKLLQPHDVDAEDCRHPRPQTQPLLYAVLVGSGVQLAIVALVVLLLGSLGFLTAAMRGSLVKCILLIFVVSSPVAGFNSARLYKAFRGRAWQQCALFTAVLYPGICFAFLMVDSVLLFFHKSSGAVSFKVLVVLVFLWCGMSIPLVMVGSFVGYRVKTLPLPNMAPKVGFSGEPSLPLSTAFRNDYAGVAIAGMLSFSVMSTELDFIMGSLWMGPFYYVYGFATITYLFLLATCSQATILLCHYRVREGSHHQLWWYSFVAPGSTGLYVFAYSFLWFSHLKALWAITYLLYFGYMLLISFTVALITGAVGALSWLWFLQATAPATTKEAAAAAAAAAATGHSMNTGTGGKQSASQRIHSFIL